ncbi:MAG: ABC transporter permease, partial [Bacilli bacterium]
DLADKYADRIIEIADSKVVRDSLSDVPERREVKVADSKKSGGLSFRSRLRLAFSFMKVRKWRMVLTIIVCSIAMCLFGLSFSFADYSREDVLKESLIYSDEPFVSLTQKDRKSNHTVTGLNDKGIERINDQTGFGFQGYLPLSTSFDSLLPYKHQGVSLDYSIPNGYEKAFYVESADKVSYLNENDLLNGYSLVCGNLPKKNDEIILTDYQVNSFKHYGIYYENKDEYIKSADFKTESLLNEKLNGFTITGILDTGFKETDYPESMIIISDPEKNSSYDYSDDDFLHSLSTSFRNCVFVSEENYHQYFDKESGFVFPGGSVISSDNKIQSPYYFRRFHSEYKGYVLFDDEAFSGDEVMVDYETLLSDSSLPRPFSIDEEDILDSALRASYSSIECEPRQFVNNSLSQLIVSNVVIKNYKTFDVDDNEDYLKYIDKTSYEGIEEDEKKKLAFSSFIADLINDSDNQSFFYLTPIQRQYLSSYDDAKKEILSKYLVKYRLILFPESDLQFTIQDNGYNSLFDLKEKVAGIDIGLGLNISKRGKVVATEDIISKTGNYEEMYYSQAISPNSHKRDEFSALLTMIDGQTGLYSLSLVGNMIEKINMVSASTSTLSTIFIWVSVSLSVFSVVLLGSYIASSAEEKEKTIGILRSMGSSSREVYSLVLIEGFLLTIMSIVLSIILLYLVSFIMNLHLSNSLGFTIMIIIPKIKEIVILFAMGLAVSFLSSFMPIINISKKSPLDYVHSL